LGARTPVPTWAATSRWTATTSHANIAALAAEGKMNPKDVARAIKAFNIDAEKGNPIGA
jgi:pyruvate dehydrogenase complex dehydrogenase (E1) component